MTYKHSDPFTDAMIYADDCERAERDHERRVAECDKQVEECLAELEKYMCADVPKFCNNLKIAASVLEMLDHLDPDGFYECAIGINDMATTDEEKIVAYNALIVSAKARLRKYFNKKIDEL